MSLPLNGRHYESVDHVCGVHHFNPSVWHTAWLTVKASYKFSRVLDPHIHTKSCSFAAGILHSGSYGT